MGTLENCSVAPSLGCNVTEMHKGVNLESSARLPQIPIFPTQSSDFASMMKLELLCYLIFITADIFLISDHRNRIVRFES